ncbi:MAG TPA: hypothetical protein VK843_18015 [Planctomycetota bacterium]|nr:hypothetical protein [Planctomycetota bacterium]
MSTWFSTRRSSSRSFRPLLLAVAAVVAVVWLLGPGGQAESSSWIQAERSLAAPGAPDGPLSVCEVEGGPQPTAAGSDPGDGTSKDAWIDRGTLAVAPLWRSRASSAERLTRSRELLFLCSNGSANAGGART